MQKCMQDQELIENKYEQNIIQKDQKLEIQEGCGKVSP